jgi:hypothetical protein
VGGALSTSGAAGAHQFERSPNGTRAEAGKLLQNGAKCTGIRQLRTRAGGWRPGRAAGSFVSAIFEGYACSACAIRVVAAPRSFLAAAAPSSAVAGQGKTEGKTESKNWANTKENEGHAVSCLKRDIPYSPHQPYRTDMAKLASMRNRGKKSTFLSKKFIRLAKSTNVS